ncbi:ATP-dependent DNA helicase RecG [Candidatus Roizmanbacteria bacterium CG_4_9_14_0_2_um_filter_39_13]|uniref:Probable DNA 3'-5' helicase RecG n=2 Tax=Candidatus Roizmaniibacteriota TaxID=1752723 RepID=A0A2M8EYS8_9BACT|nr:MAG: ATP-dependent DNA helicase RecG [Candidatus Roizmanbacteria bacterium CG_4_10_14_0_2_um_filter_39_12]PJC31778.1 MAG: ATP-dependent DNA helicase RecG [Candidatus Roizmanbacteria bacterium CG_4_9_14_0_2_um_filter_39_13]PJE61374.1 MAG: ATP-dependent DNA helicase RecG [Candidatus Roizmanbacteria bacterium CG10_big_fil_rev_8_21_14_0_10_39_12]
MIQTPEQVDLILLALPIETLPKTAPRTISRLQATGIKTYGDLLEYYPFRYNDFSITSQIGNVQAGETVTVRGNLESIKTVPTRKRITIQKAVLRDETGVIELVWYNQGYLTNTLTPGSVVSVSGVVESQGKKKSMKPMEYELLATADSKTKHTGRIVPVYPTIYGLSSKTILEKIFFVLDLLSHANESIELIPEDILKEHGLMGLQKAYETIHQPTTMREVSEARRRLGFNELFIRILSSKMIKERWSKEQTTAPIKLTSDDKKRVQEFIKNLPFVLTDAQKRVTEEVLEDIQKTVAMNRFLQGDVGSGKTVVATIAAYATHLQKRQTLIMAPTEILALQHFATISALTKNTDLKVALQTGAHKDITSQKKAGEYDLIVGTHALISAKYDFRDVALVIIDEQHRFGVKQRALLKKKGINPHLLSMTATPIPRTVTLTLYSELDLSVIDELPVGRKAIKTYLTPTAKRADGYRWIEKQIKEEKTQAYIICPLIETSEKESMSSIKAVKAEYEHLKKNIFPMLKVGLLHGRMKAKEKEQTMAEFNAHTYDILVSTSVVEVGVDVPNATIMLIEGSERYGLAQLHQLRGRVGRAEKQSYCLLFTTSNNYNPSRLRFFAKTHSGLKLSEFDLKTRGPGEIYGTQQHGYSDLKIADLSDTNQVFSAKKAVDQLLKNYSVDELPKLNAIMRSYQINLIEKN